VVGVGPELQGQIIPRDEYLRPQEKSLLPTLVPHQGFPRLCPLLDVCSRRKQRQAERASASAAEGPHRLRGPKPLGSVANTWILISPQLWELGCSVLIAYSVRSQVHSSHLAPIHLFDLSKGITFPLCAFIDVREGMGLCSNSFHSRDC
jgi:hypothetical protein